MGIARTFRGPLLGAGLLLLLGAGSGACGRSSFDEPLPPDGSGGDSGRGGNTLVGKGGASTGKGGNYSKGGDDSNCAGQTARLERRESNGGKPTAGTARTAVATRAFVV